ncbi:ROK family transcriptional regulator [Sphingomonas morindae]|uniref:ROK family transcriptional regulator n=1 Tax=Sphingomonas morindae TaxID=1541170 RepID=A0ABY4X967_9SPHN|nr:ROK family transcriptional regulator [Sphingomonas morindae]USI73466.1 ROK family transcriptional regulator [Sphingomonas morindae]
MTLLLSASERRIFDLVWRQGPIARTDLVALSGMAGPSVTRLVRSLADRNLLEERVNRTGARGQPTRPVSIRPEGGRALGIYFSHHHVEMGMVDLGGRLINHDSRPIVDASPASLARLTNDFLSDMKSMADGPLLGIGLAVPGDFIDGARRLNAHAFFPALARQDALADYAANVGEPVSVENDAASAALGERLVGVAQTIDSFLFVHIGHGVGGGIFMNGRLVRGARGNAGMLGIQFPNDRPRPSGQDLFATLSAAGIAADDFVDLEALDLNSCPVLRGWIRRAGAQLRAQLSITARLLDPDAVVIGGRLPLPLLQALTVEVGGAGFCDEGVGLPIPRVLCSALGRRAGVVGAAALPIVRTLLDWREDEALPGLPATSHY